MHSSIMDEIDEICEQFEDCQQSSSPRNLEAFLPSSWSDDARRTLTRYLLGIEMEYRAGRGEDVSVAELRARFPDWLDVEESTADIRRRALTAVPLSVLCAELQESGLVREAVLAELMSAVPPFVNSEVLLQELTRRRLLTGFQADEIRFRNTSGLRFYDYILLDRISNDDGIPAFKVVRFGRSRSSLLRLIPQELAANQPELLQRLRLDVDVASRISHPGIVKTKRFLTMPGGEVAVVSHYVEGISFPDFLAVPRTLAVWATVNYTLQIARALSYAHGLGVVHGGLQLNRLQLDETGNVRVLDLGVAQVLSDCRRSLVRSPLTTASPGISTQSLAESSVKASRIPRMADIQCLGRIFLRLLMHSSAHASVSELFADSTDVAGAVQILKTQQFDLPVVLKQILERMLVASTESNSPELTEVIKILEPCSEAPRSAGLGVR